MSVIDNISTEILLYGDGSNDFGPEHIVEVDRCLKHLEKITVKDGIKVARKILDKLEAGMPLRHPAFIEGRLTDTGDNVEALESDFNLGLMRGFKLRSLDRRTIIGGSTLQLETTGLTVSFEPVFDRFDFTQQEIDSLKGKNSMVAVLPSLPVLRAHIS